MIPKACKRLAEVDFPIAVVSKHAAREKSIHQGHPSTLHLWWARRPLAACRAILLALLLPDPCDEYCPEDFRNIAREVLPKVQGQVGASNKDLRQALLKFIGDFAAWDLSADRSYLEISRALVNAAFPEGKPLVVDTFAGGGSIPLEATRLGCDAFASDLNPVSSLVLKVLLEDIPRNGLTLAEQLTNITAGIKKDAETELAQFYPLDPDGSRPIAYLWARTARCEEPDCGAEIPLIRTNWLAKRFNKGKKLYRKLVSVDIEGSEKSKQVNTAVRIHETPTKTLPSISPPTVTNGKAICLCCKKVLNPSRVRSQLLAQEGGANMIFDRDGHRSSGARMVAVILREPLGKGVKYRDPVSSDIDAVIRAAQKLQQVTAI
jgi:putative DNA methylase